MKKLVYLLRAHNMYFVLECIVKIEHALRFRLSEKMLDAWFNNVGKHIPSVRAKMRLMQCKPDWCKLSVTDKRHVYCSEMYY